MLGKADDYARSPEFHSLISSDEDLASFIAFANVHHVIVRALEVLMSNGSLAASPHAADVCGAALAVEKRRISIAISYLEAITRKLNEAGLLFKVLEPATKTTAAAFVRPTRRIKAMYPTATYGRNSLRPA